MRIARADEAARSVLDVFVDRPAPFVRLAAVKRPARRIDHWNYWWQAHLLDCLIDATQRDSWAVQPRLMGHLLTGVWLRNGLKFRNRYFDDMAWLSLAAQRLGSSRVRLGGRLRSGITPEFGGGSFWRTDRKYKATAATGPVSLFLAREGDRQTAARLLAWLSTTLADESGLFRDGIKFNGASMEVEPLVFTYNQGPALGTMLELGDEEHLAAATRHVAAVAAHLTRPGSNVLITHGNGDGGLFTGILTRYLALAATDTRLPDDARAEAGAMVLATAENLWETRQRRIWSGRAYTVFSPDAGLGDAQHPPVVELSTQLQAWMVLESAVRVSS